MNRAAIIHAIQSRMADIVPDAQVEVASDSFVDLLLDDCVEGFYMLIPVRFLPRTEFTSNNKRLVSTDEVKVNRIKLPDNFIRLIAFRCATWKRTVSEVLAEGSPQHKAQFGKHTFGGNVRPQVTNVSDATLGNSLEYYLYTTITDYTPTEAACVVKTTAEAVPDMLIDVFAWYVAAKAFKAMGEIQYHDSAMKEVEQFVATHK